MRPQGRLIAERHTVPHCGEDHTVIVFVSVLIRGEHAYDAQFGRDPVAYGKRFFKGRFTETDLQKHIAERLKKNPVKEKQAPSNAEYSYLYQVLGQHGPGGDEVVAESADWVTLMQQPPFPNWHAVIYQGLAQGKGGEGVNGVVWNVPGKPGWGLLVRRFPEQGILFLVAPLEDVQGAKTAGIRKRYTDLLLATEVRQEDVLRRSKRAYPEIVLADDDLWLELQKEQLGNLALSPEETKILGAAKSPDGAFPIFINGRAGSGKSTILQYLFTDYLFHYLKCRDLPAPPAYFTCNAELLAQARKVVETLLRCGGKYWEHDDRAALLEGAAPVFEAAFREFHSHLRGLVPTPEREKRFPSDKWIDYARFRRRWLKKFGLNQKAVRDYSADLSWHVIRTFIKGASPDTLLEPEEYVQIEQKQRSVSQEAYEWIYTYVWKRWYRPLAEAEGLWDDQDVARFLLEQETICPQYPAIFCDEAQDFTRVELEVILRMSIFSERKLNPKDICRVPFLFAGDQFQTLNPTGFRWDAVRAWFVEKFIFELDPNRRSGLNDLNYHELTFNYRSSLPIVRFSNFVQALRARLFNISGLKPQVPWDESPAAPVMVFNPDDAKFWEALRSLSDVVFVIPCAEGEEVDFLKSDPTLRLKIPFQDDIPTLPVLSAARAKGLEFNRVVVYGFGSAADEKFLKPLRDGGSHQENPDSALPLEYFINRLYVAVSRPKRQLLVVDSDEGIQKLWAFAQDATLEAGILEGIRNGRAIWEKHIGRPEVGRSDHLGTETPVAVLENAETLAHDGRSRRDSYMLRQAAISYRNAGEDDKANRCRAEADQFDGNYLPAGDLFLKVGDLDSAIACYWEACEPGWTRILDAGGKRAEILSRLEYMFADYIAGERAPQVGPRALSELRKRLETDGTTERRRVDRPWSRAVEVTLQMILSNENPLTPDPLWAALDADVTALESMGLAVSITASAKLAYRAGCFERAARFWEKAGETNLDDYKRAKAESASYPQRLVAFHSLSAWDRIIEEQRKNSGVELGEEESGVVGVALAKTGRFRESWDHAKKSQHLRYCEEVLVTYEQAGEKKLTKAMRSIVAVLAVQHGAWETVSALMSRDGTSDLKLALALARGFGRSDALTALPGDSKFGAASQGPISEFLRRWFGAPSPSKLDAALSLEVGAAIERAGNRVDALKYYEALIRSYAKPIPHAARIRWIVCKERQAAFDDKKKDGRSSRERRGEAEEARKALEIPLQQSLPEYPALNGFKDLLKELSDISTQDMLEISSVPSQRTEAPTAISPGECAEKREIVKSPYSFVFFPSTGRLNITHQDTGETLSVKNWGSQMDGDWTFYPDPSEPGGFRSAAVPFLLKFSEEECSVFFGQDCMKLSFLRAEAASIRESV